MKKRTQHAVLLLSVLLGGVAVAAIVARGMWLPAMARWLDVGTAPRQVDYVMVMPGDENVRPFVAAAIVRTGLANELLVPEPNIPPVTDRAYQRLSQSNMVRRVLLNRDIPAESIHMLASPAKTSKGDLQALAEFLRDDHQSQVAVVTSFYHSRRTRLAARRVLGEQAKQLSFVSAPVDEFDVQNWWQVENGMVSVLTEYVKLAFYAVSCRMARS